MSVHLQLKMRGQQVRFNENGDGEVDEQFWAQAAADQAAGRAAAEDDEGETIIYSCVIFLKLAPLLKAEMDQIYPSIRSSSIMTTMMARALTMVLMATVQRRRMLESKTSWLLRRARRGGSDQNLSIMLSVLSG